MGCDAATGNQTDQFSAPSTRLRKGIFSGCVGVVLGLLVGTSASADDIEIFTSGQVGPKPNIYFILDISSSMNTVTPTGTRLSDLQGAMSEFLLSNIGKINVGYTTYDTHALGPVQDVATLDAALSTQLQTGINALTAGSGTNSTGALFESVVHLQDAYNDDSSLVSSECAQTFMVMVSDGLPDPVVPSGLTAMGIDPSTCVTPFGQDCGAEVAAFAANNDLNPAIADSFLSTYTIGFSAPPEGEDYLETIANNGNGDFYSADGAAALKDALVNITNSIYAGSRNFSELAINVDKTSFSHDNRVFFSLFSPSNQSSWKGNIKGYFRDGDGTIRDTLNQPAMINDNTGQRFADDARSFWSDVVDGNEIEIGGANGQLDPANRNLLTYTAETIPTNGADLVTASDIHAIDISNTELTAALMNLSDPSKRDTLISWLRNAPMGDALHSKMQVVNYETGTVVFGMTNQGLFHAIDATAPGTFSEHDGGSELFAFMPPGLLGNLAALEDPPLASEHIYGLDGAISRWHDDENGDGIVNGGDTLMMIFGMRRGGNTYHALDVTDPLEPRYMWRIEGGVTPGFDDLAQSWSRMSLITVKRPGTAATAVTEMNTDRVLVFAGGYDAAQLDDGPKREVASGGAVYMVDRAGHLIWKTESEMDYSMPADLSVIDSNSDDLADRIYAADLGGQIWRIDFDNVDDAADYAVTQIADLGTSSEQPFFYPPAVSLHFKNGAPFLSLSIGSGDRDRPLLEPTDNKLLSIRDRDVEKGAPETAPTLVTMSTLYNASDYDFGSSSAIIREAAESVLNAADGWYINLDNAEKSLSEVVVFENSMLATTFAPADANAEDDCEAATPKAFFYTLDPLNGNPLYTLSSETPSHSSEIIVAVDDRRRALNTFSIPPSPLPLTNEGSGTIQIIVDKEIALETTQSVRQVYWANQQQF